MATHAAENDGHYLTWVSKSEVGIDLEASWLGLFRQEPYVSSSMAQDIRVCPSATIPATDILGGQEVPGGTFYAWGRRDSKALNSSVKNYPLYGSYGLSLWVSGAPVNIAPARLGQIWESADVRRADRIPIMVDSDTTPPTRDSTPIWVPDSSCGHFSCMNRHSSGVNVLFLDWSVRKVGLKELWKLRWYRDFPTNGPWTKAGGVEPGDWPQWMRKFKDY